MKIFSVFRIMPFLCRKKRLFYEDADSRRQICFEGTRTMLVGEGTLCDGIAVDFDSALEKIEVYDYDCILLDIMLPGGSGLELLGRLKELRIKENVIIISAKGSLEDYTEVIITRSLTGKELPSHCLYTDQRETGFPSEYEAFLSVLEWLDNFRLGKKNVSLDNPAHITEFQKLNETLSVVLVTNLLKNAFLHNKNKGVIRVEIDSSTIRFGNTGADILLDEKRIFERFYQGDKKKEGLTGLGLAIVDAICRQSGFRFVIILPKRCIGLNFSFELFCIEQNTL